jgi:hypothetical protein
LHILQYSYIKPSVKQEIYDQAAKILSRISSWMVALRRHIDLVYGMCS